MVVILKKRKIVFKFNYSLLKSCSSNKTKELYEQKGSMEIVRKENREWRLSCKSVNDWRKESAIVTSYYTSSFGFNIITFIKYNLHIKFYTTIMPFSWNFSWHGILWILIKQGFRY